MVVQVAELAVMFAGRNKDRHGFQVIRRCRVRDHPHDGRPCLAAHLRRLLQRIDGDALDDAIVTWLAARDPDRPQLGRPPAGWPLASLAVDRKTVRGARSTDGTQVHLLAVMTGAGLVTAQREVDG